MSTLNALLSTCQAEQAPLLARMMKRQASYAAMRDRFIVWSAVFWGDIGDYGHAFFSETLYAIRFDYPWIPPNLNTLR